MTFDDNACIRYLMKEMDPSEELLFEQKMLDDDDLLIEVESLRKVNSRLSKLPNAEPPAHLTRKILQDASRHYTSKRRKQSGVIYVSAAATILVLFFSGAFLIYEQESFMFEQESTASESEAGLRPLEPARTLNLNTESASNGVSPWVDNNQELHFDESFNTETAAFDSILNSSFQRLRPVQSLESRDRSVRGLHLTGGR